VTISTENEVEMVSPDNESGKKKNGVSDDEWLPTSHLVL
jgi:hypothetical protein